MHTGGVGASVAGSCSLFQCHAVRRLGHLVPLLLCRQLGCGYITPVMVVVSVLKRCTGDGEAAAGSWCGAAAGVFG